MEGCLRWGLIFYYICWKARAVGVASVFWTLQMTRASFYVSCASFSECKCLNFSPPQIDCAFPFKTLLAKASRADFPALNEWIYLTDGKGAGRCITTAGCTAS